MIRKLSAIGLAVSALLAARPAGALLVVGTDKAHSQGPETRLLVLREDSRSVIAVAPTVRGPQKPIAMILPVPKAAVSTLRAVPITLLEHTDKLSAPRLEELWELDPCELHPNQQSAPPSPSAGAAPSAAASAEPESGPKKEGDYEISVLPEGRDEAVKWLRDNGYVLPEGADSVLGSLFKEGTALAVARIDGERLTFQNDVARLPPLAFVADGASSLPIAQALTGGSQDTIIDILSPTSRFEAANLLNVAVPTNLDVTEAAKSDKEGLYGALIDYTFEQAPGTAVTEYAWLAAACDGCEGVTGIGPEDLLALGSDKLPSAEDGSQREVMVDVAEALARAPEGPPELKQALSACYGKALGEMAGLSGSATVTVETGEGGRVKATKIDDASAEALGRCVEEAAKATTFEHPGAKGTIQSRFALVSRAYLGQMVLSRLRVRNAGGSGAEVTLRAAAAIEGGREEGPEGEAEKKVYFAENANNFRARYVVRHPWTGPITCGNPKRGVWSARPPNGADRAPGPPPSPAPEPSSSASVSGTARAPSAAEQKLRGLLLGGRLPNVDAFKIRFRAISAPKATTAPLLPSPTASAGATTTSSASGQSSGCGCRVASDPTKATGKIAPLVLIPLLWARRRRKFASIRRRARQTLGSPDRGIR